MSAFFIIQTHKNYTFVCSKILAFSNIDWANSSTFSPVQIMLFFSKFASAVFISAKLPKAPLKSTPPPPDVLSKFGLKNSVSPTLLAVAFILLRKPTNTASRL